MRHLRVLLFVTLCGLVLTLPRHAFAHAMLVQSTPQAHAVVQGPEAAIELKYNSRVDASRSSLVLLAPGGKLLPLSATQSGPGALTARAAQLTKGSYVLRWQVLSSDGHISRGEIPFEVK
jgi:copper resistance protein C